MSLASLLSPSRIDLFPYQEEGIARVRAALGRGRRAVLVVMPTGTGKTILMGAIARLALEKGSRVLLLAHRDNLINQAADKLSAMGLPVAVEKATQHARSGPPGPCLFDPDAPRGPACVVASVQTLRGPRLASWPKDYFKLIFTDEAHHSTADSYRKIYGHFAGYRHVGVTATPDRLDGAGLGRVFEEVAYEIPLAEAVRRGWLVRPTFVRCEDVVVDLRRINTRTMGDMSDSDVALAIRPHVEPLANAFKRELGDRKAIFFLPGVLCAELMATALQSLGLKAEGVSGATRAPSEVYSAFARGDVQVLCNDSLLTEGYDERSVSAIGFGRPTMSRARYAQEWGRGLRLDPASGKTSCRGIDFGWLTAQHQILMGPTDLFDPGPGPPAARQAARQEVEQGETDDVLEAIERAEAEHRRRERVRLAVRERDVRYRRVVWDPFRDQADVLRVLGVPPGDDPEDAPRATPAQAAYLEQLGIAGAATMSRRRADQILDHNRAQREQGRRTFKQARLLLSLEVDPAEVATMGFDEASDRLDGLKGRR